MQDNQIEPPAQPGELATDAECERQSRIVTAADASDASDVNLGKFLDAALLDISK